MTPHGLIEQLRKKEYDPLIGQLTESFMERAVVFYVGDIKAVPRCDVGAACVPPPFDDVLLCFTDKSGGHGFIGCASMDDHWVCFYLSKSPSSDRLFFSGVWSFYPETDEIDAGPENRTDKHLPAFSKATGFLKSFFSVIACSNVRMVDVPAPEALNKKRARTGKPPIKSHKVLHIVAPSSYSKAAPQGGTHASPRVHLRRGHIRKNPSGTTTWVQQCVVGSKHGIVTKDYRVSYAGAAA